MIESLVVLLVGAAIVKLAVVSPVPGDGVSYRYLES
jgi:hypothetical protein